MSKLKKAAKKHAKREVSSLVPSKNKISKKKIKAWAKEDFIAGAEWQKKQ